MGYTQTSTSVILSIYFVLLIVLTLGLRSSLVSGVWIFLFRAFFPSWKFFDEIGDMPVLFWRTSTNSENQFSPWQPVIQKKVPRITQILFNPEGNFDLAHQSLCQQLATDLDHHTNESISDLESEVSYQLILRLIRHHILKSQEVITDQAYFQFKLSTTTQEDWLVSKPYRIKDDQ